MALREGIDTCGFVSLGVYTETYTSADSGGDPVADLFASMGMLEAVPIGVAPTVGKKHKWFELFGFIGR